MLNSCFFLLNRFNHQSFLLYFLKIYFLEYILFLLMLRKFFLLPMLLDIVFKRYLKQKLILIFE